LIRIFTDTAHYTPALRPYLADILRPLINQRTLEQNRSVYGSVVDQYLLVDDISQADWAVLPFAWNYYHKSNLTPQALEFIVRARGAGKPVLTWVTGDFGARVPVSDVWVFGAAGYRSRAGEKRFGSPVFIRDPLIELGMGKKIVVRNKGARPRIGFCGYASISSVKSIGFAMRTLIRNITSALHLSSDEPQEPYPAVLLRQQVLESLEHSPLVEAAFIRRAQYKAGVSNQEQERSTKREFFNNIRDTDYTVCVRGGGNFSVRLYETLAMGRIPILIDTDCLLPYANDPRWRECCVYVERGEISNVAEKVSDFHARLSEDDFLEIQHRARRFWEECLSFNGFFTRFPEHFI
jgi:hypothetical protein